MIITDVKSGSKVNQTRRKGASKASSNDLFSLELEANSAPTQEVVQVQNTSNIQSVISIDTMGVFSNIANEEYIVKENIDWSKNLLKELENIKYQILNGKISYNTLLNLKERLNNIPINPSDVKLKQIVEDIEIRATVELEKLKKFTNQNL
jgi:hypothetical protein